MKSKTFGKKLTLNKKTIADLNNGEMMNAHGMGLGSLDLTECCVTVPIRQCTFTDDCCPTICTCGTGDPLCPCVSIDEG